MLLSRRSLLALAAALPAAGHAAATQRPRSVPRYTMTAFTNDSETDLYVYESDDAITFRQLSGPAYRPPTGLLRDPSVFRNIDGYYYLTYTTGWEGRTIGFAYSADRMNWSHLYDITVPLPGVTSTWAPEWFIDSDRSINVIVSLSDGYRFTPHLITAESKLRAWSMPRPMIGLAQPDNTSYGYIDTTVVRADRRYYAFTKNESTKYIELAVADHLLGPYTFVATDDWAGWGAPVEGQCVIALPDGGWRIYFDAYTDHQYFYSDCYDDFRTWTTPLELPEISGTVRHFTVFPEFIEQPDS